MKLLIIARIALPVMMMASAYLKAHDVNTTGTDDNAAKALDVAIAALQELLRTSTTAIAVQAKAEGLI